MSTERIPLNKLVLDHAVQARVSLNNDAVHEYAEQYAAQRESKSRLKNELPPVCVWMVGKKPYLVDGFHRVAAAAVAGVPALACSIVGQGTMEEARWAALQYNHKHGVKRTNTDKRKAAEIAVELRPNESDNALADHAGVSRTAIQLARTRLPKKQPDDLSTGNHSCEIYPTPANDSEDKDDIDWGGTAEEPCDLASTDSSKLASEPKHKHAPKPKERRRGKDGKMYPVNDGKGKAAKAYKEDAVLVDADKSVRRALADVRKMQKESGEASYAYSVLAHAIQGLSHVAYTIVSSERVPCEACAGRTDEVKQCHVCNTRRWITRGTAREMAREMAR